MFGMCCVPGAVAGVDALGAGDGGERECGGRAAAHRPHARRLQGVRAVCPTLRLRAAGQYTLTFLLCTILPWYN